MGDGPRDWTPPKSSSSSPSGSLYDYGSEWEEPPPPGVVTLNNGYGWLSLLFGVLTIVYALTQTQRFPPLHSLTASLMGFFAMGWGIVALALRRRGEASGVVAPVTGVLLGLAGTMVLTFFLVSVVLTIPGFLSPSTVGKLDSRSVWMRSDPSLTAEEMESDAIANGLLMLLISLPETPPEAWPESVTLDELDGTLRFPDGYYLTQFPVGTEVEYSLSPDGQSFRLTAYGQDFGTTFTFDSATRKISEGWLGPAGVDCAVSHPDSPNSTPCNILV